MDVFAQSIQQGRAIPRLMHGDRWRMAVQGGATAIQPPTLGSHLQILALDSPQNTGLENQGVRLYVQGS